MSLATGELSPLLTWCRSVNVIEGEPNDRIMTTGNHTVRDIYCCKCGQTLGWKYVRVVMHTLVTRAYSAYDADANIGPGIRGIAEIQGGQVHLGAQPPC